MIQTLKTSTIENRLPIYKVENDCIISVYGDITIGFKVELPPIFSMSSADYERLHTTFLNAIKVLPMYSVIHKQDIFLTENYHYKPDPNKEPDSYLSSEHQRHFENRPYLTHSCYLYVSLTSRQNIRKQSLLTTLCRGNLIPKEYLDDEKIAKFLEAVEQFATILNKSHLSVKRLTTDEIVGTNTTPGIIDKYLTLKRDDEEFILKDISFFPEKLKIGDKEVFVHSVSNVDDLPAIIFNHSKYEPLSTENSECLVSYAAPASVLLPYNHIYNQYIFLDDPQFITNQLEGMVKRMHSLSKLSRQNAINSELIREFLNEIHSTEKKIVRMHANIISWADESSTPEKVKNESGSAFSDMNCKVRHNTIDAPMVYWAGIPGNAADFPAEDTIVTSLDIALCLFSFETFEKSLQSPFGIYLSDRLTHRPLHVDISDKPKNDSIVHNRNKFIIGPSGSGKSFTTNHIVRQYYEQGTHVVLIDVGNSYEAQCQMINEMTGGKDGIYYTYTEENPISFNPFYTDDDVFDIEKLESIKTLIVTLWKKDDEPMTRYEETIVEDTVNGYLKLIKSNKTIRPCFNTYYDFLKDTFFPALRKDVNFDPTLFNIASFMKVLSVYAEGGKYDYLLNSDKNIDLLNKRFVVFELDNIKDHPIIFPVVTIIIMETFINKMRRLHGIRKMILIEEAWKAIAKANMADYIKYLFKTVRKHFGEAVIITQEVDDIISSDIVKETIISNSGCKILLDQSMYANRFEEIQRLLGLTDKQKALALSLNKDMDPKLKYKEVFIGLGDRGAVYATEVSKAEFWAYNTEQEVKKVLFDKAKEKGSIIEAIKELSSK